MKALSKSVKRAKERVESDRREKEYQEWFESLSDEEKERHLAEKRESARRGARTWAQLCALQASLTPYTMQGGRKGK